MRTSEEIGKLMAALVEASKNFDHLSKNAEGQYRYANLPQVQKCTNRHLFAEGLKIIQGERFDGDREIIVTRLIHVSGEYIETDWNVVTGGGRLKGSQANGSATTYAKRYAWCAICGISHDDDDDDGQKASDEYKNIQNKPKAGAGRRIHPRNNQQREPYPQEYPAVDALPKLAQIMGWPSMPAISGYLATVAQGVEAADFTADQVTERVKSAFLEAYQSAGGSTRDEWSPEQVEALKNIGNVTECGDIVALCRGVDVLR